MPCNAEPTPTLAVDVYAVSELESSPDVEREKPKSALSTAMKFVANSWNALTESLAETYSVLSEKSKIELRETHPRMPWHDCHAAVSGAAARDVASHFIQVFI